MKRHIHKLLLLLFTSIITVNLNGQEKCSEILLLANTAYNEGKYEQVISLLDTNIANCNFHKVERQQATKLLASALAELDEIEKAEGYVYSLLKKNPNYVVQSTVDPLPFINMMDKYTRSPRSIIGFTIGQTLPLLSTQKTYNTWSETDAGSNYKSELGLTFSLYYQYYINKKWSLSFEPEYSTLKYSRELTTYEDINLNYNEKASTITLPINIGYKVYQRNNFSAGISAGLYTSLLLSASGELNYQIPEAGVIENKENMSALRRTQNYGYQTGLNLTYTKNKLRYTATLGYAHDFKTFNNPDNRYSNNSLMQDYNYTDDDINLSQLKFKLGIAYTISYKVKHKYRSK